MTHYTKTDEDSTDLKIFYKLCVYGDCVLSEEEARGVGNVESAILDKRTVTYGSQSRDEVNDAFVYSSEINHDFESCFNVDHCIYVFSLYNPSA